MPKSTLFASSIIRLIIDKSLPLSLSEPGSRPQSPACFPSFFPTCLSVKSTCEDLSTWLRAKVTASLDVSPRMIFIFATLRCPFARSSSASISLNCLYRSRSSLGLTPCTSSASGSPSKLGTTLQSQFLWKCLNSPAVLRVW